MMRVLFVSNGHGEIAIAARIARELPQRCDHLALVGGAGAADPALDEVGPRRAMPSGGLVAMGNVRNLARDLRAGLARHTLAQAAFLRSARARYDAVVAVGDVYALGLSLLAGLPAIFVGTAKSVYVAPYGPFEERLLRRARVVFVRDLPTAQRLRAHGIPARAANVIRDLYPHAHPAPAGDPELALLPGSREEAYREAAFLCALVRTLAPDFPDAHARLSIAPNLDAGRMVQGFDSNEWTIERSARSFVLRVGARALVHAERAPLDDLLASASLVLGQAGTANEAAAGAGVPVVAFTSPGRAPDWYRRRQAGLLGEALLLLPHEVEPAARGVAALLRDPARQARMASAGRERVGPAGSAALVASAIVEFAT